MNEPFLHFDAGNVVTWGIVLLTFAYNYGKSAQRFLENRSKIAENNVRLTALETKLEIIQVEGSPGAHHMFELVNSRLSDHEVRITLHDSTVKDVVEIKTKVDLMLGLMKRRWHLDEDKT